MKQVQLLPILLTDWSWNGDLRSKIINIKLHSMKHLTTLRHVRLGHPTKIHLLCAFFRRQCVFWFKTIAEIRMLRQLFVLPVLQQIYQFSFDKIGRADIYFFYFPFVWHIVLHDPRILLFLSINCQYQRPVW